MLHGRIRPFSRTRGAPGNQPTQAETTSWQAAVVTNAGTVSAGRFTVVNNFIAAEKAAGTWALTDDYWGLWGENVPQALTSLKQLRLATSVSAPNFTADRGYVFDGVVNYLNTGFIGSTHGINLSPTAGRLAVYERTNLASNGMAISAETASTYFWLIPRLAGAGRVESRIYSSVVLDTVAVIPNGMGLTSAYLKAGPESGWYKNGVLLETIANTPTAVTAPTVAFFIGARNLSGAATSFRAASIGFAAVGGPLTAAQEQAQYTNVQAWASAVGAAV